MKTSFPVAKMRINESLQRGIDNKKSLIHEKAGRFLLVCGLDLYQDFDRPDLL